MEYDRYRSTRELLRKIPRYRSRSLLYPSNVALHEERTLALLQAAFSFVVEHLPLERIDAKLTFALAKVHDDVELAIGMGTEDHRPFAKIHGMNGRYHFEVDGFDQRELLTLYCENTRLETQLVAYADAFDSLGECVHEVAGGNASFIDMVTERLDRLRALADGYPRMAPLFQTGHPMFAPPDFRVDVLQRIGAHTVETLVEASGYTPYDFWCKALIHGSVETYASLLQRREGIQSQPSQPTAK